LSALFLTAFALRLRRPKKFLTPSRGPLAGRARPLFCLLGQLSKKTSFTSNAIFCSVCFPARAKRLTKPREIRVLYGLAGAGSCHAARSTRPAGAARRRRGSPEKKEAAHPDDLFYSSKTNEIVYSITRRS